MDIQDIYKLVVEATGSGDVEKLAAANQALDKILRDVNEQMEINEATYLAGLTLTEEYEKEVRRLVNAEQAIVDGRGKILTSFDALLAAERAAYQETERLAAAHAAMVKAQEKAGAGAAAEAAYIQSLVEALGREEVAAEKATIAQNKVRGATAATGTASQAASRGFLELSRGIEDFATGGPIGLLNNIPGIIQSFGTAAGMSAAGIAGLTAGVSLLSTAAFMLYKNWDQVQKLLGTGIPRPATEGLEGISDALKAAQKEMDKLKEKTTLSLVELFKYRDLKDQIAGLTAKEKQEREMKALLERKTEGEAETGGLATKAVAEHGGERAFEEISRAISDIADESGKIRSNWLEITGPAEDIAKKLLLAFTQGQKGAGAELLDMMGKAPGGRESPLMRDIANALSGIKTQREIEAEGQANARKIDQDSREKRNREADAAKQKNDAEIAGAQGQIAGSIASGFKTEIDDAAKMAGAKAASEGKNAEQAIRQYIKDQLARSNVAENMRSPVAAILQRRIFPKFQAELGMQAGDTDAARGKNLIDDLKKKEIKAAQKIKDAQHRKNLAASKLAFNQEVSGVGGPSQAAMLEMAMLQNQMMRSRGVKGALPDKAAAEFLTARLAQQLQRSGRDTDPLHAYAVASKVVEKAQADLQNKIGQSMALVQNGQMAQATVMEGFAEKLRTMDQQQIMLIQRFMGMAPQGNHRRPGR